MLLGDKNCYQLKQIVKIKETFWYELKGNYIFPMYGKAQSI